MVTIDGETLKKLLQRKKTQPQIIFDSLLEQEEFELFKDSFDPPPENAAT